MVDPYPDDAPLQPEADRSSSYRSQAAATLREACGASGRPLGELAAVLSERFERRVSVDELRSWLAAECEFPIAAVAAISELGPAPQPAVTPELEPGPEPAPAPRRHRGRRPLAVALSAGALLLIGGVTAAQAMTGPDPVATTSSGGGTESRVITPWSSPTPVASNTPQRVAIAPVVPDTTTGATPNTQQAASQDGQSSQGGQTGGAATPSTGRGQAQPSGQQPAATTPSAPAPAAATPAPSPTPTPTPTPADSSPPASAPGESGGGLVGGLLGSLLGLI
jgi:hypothetical protein